MGGFFGVASKEDCVFDLFFGTDYHSHLGTKRGGLAIQGRDGSFTRKIHDITNAQFRSKFDNDIPRFSGVAGIGSISDGEAQPLLISSKFGNFAIVTVGRINNIDKIVNKAFDLGHTHLTENGDGEVNPTEIVAMLICTKKSITEKRLCCRIYHPDGHRRFARRNGRRYENSDRCRTRLLGVRYYQKQE